MSDVLEFASFHLARCQGQTRMLPLQRLNTGQFIRRDDAVSLLGQLGRFVVDTTDIGDLRIKLVVLGRGELIADQVRFEVPLLRRRAAWRPEILGTMPRFWISLASSRLVHWLMDRWESAGGSQANATIWVTCSAVM